MNLVLSGPIDESLLHAVKTSVMPATLTAIHEHAWRFGQVDDSEPSRLKVAELCASAQVDHAFLDSDTRFAEIKLLVLDMDSTLITIECIDEMADFVGKKHEVAAITEATMRGEIKDFSESLKRRVALLRGAHVDVMRRVFDERLKLSPGADALIAAARANEAYILLVSGGFTYFADRLKAMLGLDEALANRLETVDAHLTGCLIAPIVDSVAKADCVNKAMISTGSSNQQAMVIGDGANDMAMMRYVAHSIAYRAKPVVREVARIAITYGSLKTTLDFFS